MALDCVGFVLSNPGCRDYVHWEMSHTGTTSPVLPMTHLAEGEVVLASINTTGSRESRVESPTVRQGQDSST